MKQYMILHYGFEKPTPEEMDAWRSWFARIAGRQVDRGGLRGGREILPSETRELPFAADSLTGYTIIQAKSLDEAEEIARQCPIVASTRVFEIMR